MDFVHYICAGHTALIKGRVKKKMVHKCLITIKL